MFETKKTVLLRSSSHTVLTDPDDQDRQGNVANRRTTICTIAAEKTDSRVSALLTMEMPQRPAPLDQRWRNFVSQQAADAPSGFTVQSARERRLRKIRQVGTISALATPRHNNSKPIATLATYGCKQLSGHRALGAV